MLPRILVSDLRNWLPTKLRLMIVMSLQRTQRTLR